MASGFSGIGPQLNEFLNIIRPELAEKSIYVKGARWTSFENQRAKGDSLVICVSTVVPDLFFGRKYGTDEWISQRRSLIGSLYGTSLYNNLSKIVPETRVYLDAYPVSEEKNYVITSEPAVNDDVEVISVSKLLEQGTIQKEGGIYKSCLKYGLSEALLESGHLVSPDPITIESFQAIYKSRGTESVLEIGAGVSPSALFAEKKGIKDYTLIDFSENVTDYISKRHPDYKTIRGSGLDSRLMLPVLDRHYDVILLGMPYELNPAFIGDFGTALDADFLSIQSGCPGFYQWEHEMLMGKENTRDWPWWNEKIVVGNNFPVALETSFSYQHCIIAAKNNPDTGKLVRNLISKGFYDHEWIGETKINS